MNSTSDKPGAQPPSLAELEDITRRALAGLPPEFKKLAEGVALLVTDFPDEETMAAMEIDDPFEILGLYHGLSLDQKSVADVADDVDRVFIYRRPVLDYWCETGEPLDQIVRHVLIHEIGHHFGLSDDDMAAIEAAG